MLTSPQEWFQNVAMALKQLQLKVIGYYSHQRAQGLELASGHMKSHVHSFSSTFILSHTEPHSLGETEADPWLLKLMPLDPVV